MAWLAASSGRDDQAMVSRSGKENFGSTRVIRN
jgi:hypothetical protein